MRTLLPLACVALSAAAQVADRRAQMDRRIHSVVDGFAATVSLYAKNLDSGAAYGIRENERVRTASTIKLPMMCAVFAAVASGRAEWNEEITLRDNDKVSGSGVLFEFSSGVRFPIRDLVHLMIVASDNTAANLLIDRFTADAANDLMDQYGLRQTRLLRKIRGDGSALKAAGGWSKAGRQPENQRFGLGVSTPREMVLLLEKIERGEVVSAAASKEMIAILTRQQLKDGIGRRLGGGVTVASKSGALDALRSDAGIVYGKGGRIAIAATVDDMPQVDYTADNAGNILIAEIAKALVEGLSR